MEDWKNISISLNNTFPELLCEVVEYLAYMCFDPTPEELEFILTSIETFESHKGMNKIISSVWNLRAKHLLKRIVSNLDNYKRIKKFKETQRITLLKFSNESINECMLFSNKLLSDYENLVKPIVKKFNDEFMEKFEELIPTCPISLDPIVNRCFLPCGHLFERESIKQLVENRCPLCRSHFQRWRLDLDE
jgi:hypothetical protein